MIRAFTTIKKRTEFVQYDMECFEKEFSSSFEKISFEQAVVLEHLEEKYYWLDIKPPYFLNKYTENKDFSLIKLFIEDDLKNNNWKKAQKIKEQNIKKLIADYNIDNFRNLFKICKKYEKLNLHNSHLVGDGLYMVFKNLDEKPRLYTEIVEIYLEEFPYFWQTSKIITFNLIKLIGKNKAIDIIKNTTGKLNSFLFCSFYELLPKDLIDNNVCSGIEDFIKKEVLYESPRIINVYALEKYKAKNSSIINKITKIIINSNKCTSLIREYLDFYIREDEIQKLIKIFDNNWELLEKIYLLQLENFVDFQHLLFNELTKNNPDFWDKFIIKLINLKEIPSQLNDIFERIWRKNDYKEYINIATAKIFTKDDFRIYKYDDIISLIFRNSQNAAEIVKNNKKQWIKNFILKNIKNKERLKIIFDIIVDCFRSDKIEYFKILLKNNIDFETFKQIPLFTWNDSWSGSQIPLIDEKIKFLYELRELIQGISFIEHKNYINKNIEYQNKEKERVKQREYIENYYDA